MGISELLLIIFTLFGLVFGRVVNAESEESSPNVVNELLNLLDEKNERHGEQVEQQRILFPVEQVGWHGPAGIGQIVGVSVDPSGNPVIFHRADRVWNFDTFDDNLEYREAFRGPIQQDTVLILDSLSGAVVNAWGADMFYLPHGFHIDPAGNTWLTDVALHQVFKFSASGVEPKFILGERFVRGSDDQHFCQPTSVAVSRTGEIVVADGYCNNRIMLFDRSEFVTLRVPHALAILDQGDVCVADRENMRIICLNIGLHVNSKGNEERGPPLTLHQPDLGRVFAVAANGNTLYAVNGPTSPIIPIRGFIMDPNSETIFGHWAPTTQSFMQPHAMAISPNGTELYVTEIGPNRIWKFHLVREPSRQADPQSLMTI